MMPPRRDAKAAYAMLALARIGVEQRGIAARQAWREAPRLLGAIPPELCCCRHDPLAETVARV